MAQEIHTITMNKIMTPDMANFSGNIHGGYLMQFLDHVGYVCATRYTQLPTVTAGVDLLNFQQPVFVAELITSRASVNYTGKTSMEIGIRTEAENITTGKTRHVISAYFTFVAVDPETKKPTAVPPLEIKTTVQQRRWRAAELRRQLRNEYQTQHHALKIGDGK